MENYKRFITTYISHHHNMARFLFWSLATLGIIGVLFNGIVTLIAFDGGTKGYPSLPFWIWIPGIISLIYIILMSFLTFNSESK